MLGCDVEGSRQRQHRPISLARRQEHGVIPQVGAAGLEQREGERALPRSRAAGDEDAAAVGRHERARVEVEEAAPAQRDDEGDEQEHVCEEVAVPQRILGDVDLQERSSRRDARAGMTVPEEEIVAVGVAVEDAVVEAARTGGARKRRARAQDQAQVGGARGVVPREGAQQLGGRRDCPPVTLDGQRHAVEAKAHRVSVP